MGDLFSRRSALAALAAMLIFPSGCALLPQRRFHFRLIIKAFCFGQITEAESVLAMRAIDIDGLLSPWAPWRTQIKGRGPIINLGEYGVLAALLRPNRQTDRDAMRDLSYLPYMLGDRVDARDVPSRINDSEVRPLIMLDSAASLPSNVAVPEQFAPELAWIERKGERITALPAQVTDIDAKSSGEIKDVTFELEKTALSPTVNLPSWAGWLNVPGSGAIAPCLADCVMEDELIAPSFQPNLP